MSQIFGSGLSACYSISNRLSPCNCFHLRCVSTSLSSRAVGAVSPYQPSLPFWWSLIYLDFLLISYLCSGLGCLLLLLGRLLVFFFYVAVGFEGLFKCLCIWKLRFQHPQCWQNLRSFRISENPKPEQASCSVLCWKAVNRQKSRWWKHSCVIALLLILSNTKLVKSYFYLQIRHLIKSWPNESFD